VTSTATSPFREVRGALYASPAPDPSRLVLTTEAHLPVAGRVVQVPFAAGADRWTLVVGARTPLSGTFPEHSAWVLLGIGLVAAVLASAIVQTLARRQQFANTLVDERTRQLEETRAFLQRLLVSGPTVVLRADLTDPARAISYISPNVERIFGLDPDEILGVGALRPWIHPEDVDALRATVERLRDAKPDPELLEFRLRHGDGVYRWVSSISVPELDDHGVAAGAFVYLTDISQQREAEDRLRVAQRAAEAANRSKSEFLSRMSHELRTPLNAVLGFGQLLEMQPLTVEQADAVDQILMGGRHLLTLINEVLDIARIEAGRLLLSPEAVHVSEIVRESLDLVRPLADQRGISMVADDGTLDSYVFADRQRTKQVLLNLLSNAVKYNRRRGTVAVSCAESGGTRLRVSVGDTGPGIRPEQMDRLFTPFDRLDAADTDVEGTGIGLTLSKHLAEAMGGALAVESVVGQGSTFSIDLPRVEGPLERYERHQPDGASSRGDPTDAPPPAGGRPHKLLYIEDNLSNVKLMERVLARRGDVEVVSAVQGRLGVELARQHRPSVILLDLHLPDVNGEEILRRLRDDPATASIPVVMVTADATVGQVQRLLSAGAAAYLTKPLDVGQLLGVVDEVLSEDGG
ncbi:MAG: ATP-binding protein, partial [Actinomycetota bacterium]|nr:ATP-binding protein [Actinomycetota bacterium]